MGTKIPMVIDFDATGSVQAMHREDMLPLGFLGQQTIERASDIRFDAETQTWGIWLADGKSGFLPPIDAARGLATYEGARQLEIRWLELCRLLSFEPHSFSGRRVLLTATEEAADRA